MSINLTEKQIGVLRFFRDYRQERSISPTLEEASEALGVSKVTVYEHLNQLIKKGAVRRDRAKARSVTILYDPDQPSDAGQTDSLTNPATLPILGVIAAGRPIEAIEDREEVSLEELVPSDAGHYLLRVRGNSMVEDHIEDGDLVVVEPRKTARNGEIIVAILDDEEATLKRFHREKKGYRLQPANAELQPIYVDNLQIRGVVRGVIRRFR